MACPAFLGLPGLINQRLSRNCYAVAAGRSAGAILTVSPAASVFAAAATPGSAASDIHSTILFSCARPI